MLPPGSRAPAVWQTVQFIARPKGYVRSIRARFGDAVSFDSLVGRGVAVMDPVLAREVFATPAESFEVIDAVGGLFGTRAVIATSGTLHKRQRKLLNPPFHGPRIKALFGTMKRVVDEHLVAFAKSRPSDTITMTSITQALTLDVILETVFGSGADAHDLERGRDVLRSIVHGFSPTLISTAKLHSPLFPPWRRYETARHAFDRWVSKVIAKRRLGGQLGDDLLGLFLTAKYDDGEPMSDGEIHDHLVTLLLAGHETSATAMAWATYWLLREPTVLARLRDEVDSLGPRPAVEALVRLPYLGAVVSESLRIEPVVTDVVRKCRVPVTVGPWTIPAGQSIAVMIGSILGDERVYPEPDRFRPERFLERKFHAGEFLPFGGGQRRCLGAAFAEAELAIAVAAIATEWELALVDDRRETSIRRNITMGPKRGVRVKVIGRRTRAESHPATMTMTA